MPVRCSLLSTRMLFFPLTKPPMRCRSCEFEDGCEWREMKAKQLYEETLARKRLLAEVRSTKS